MRFLSNKEKKQLKALLPLGYTVDKKDEIKEHEGILLKNDEKYLIVKSGEYLPHLKSLPRDEYKAVFVDRGAVPFLAKGADLMRPGIQKVEHDFAKDALVPIVDQDSNRVVALGRALMSSEEIENQEKGKSLSVYHYVGDELY